MGLREPRTVSGHKEIVAGFDQAIDGLVAGVFLGDEGMDAFDQILRLPFFQDEVRALFLGDFAEFVAGIFGSDGVVEFAFDGQIKPFLSAGFELEAHARGIAKRAEEADGHVGKAVNGEGANFAVLDVGESVGGIEKESTGGRIEGDGDGVERESRGGGDPP